MPLTAFHVALNYLVVTRTVVIVRTTYRATMGSANTAPSMYHWICLEGRIHCLRLLRASDVNSSTALIEPHNGAGALHRCVSNTHWSTAHNSHTTTPDRTRPSRHPFVITRMYTSKHPRMCTASIDVN